MVELGLFDLIKQKIFGIKYLLFIFYSQSCIIV